jgi:hypothetical protein
LATWLELIGVITFLEHGGGVCRGKSILKTMHFQVQFEFLVIALKSVDLIQIGSLN